MRRTTLWRAVTLSLLLCCATLASRAQDPVPAKPVPAVPAAPAKAKPAKAPAAAKDKDFDVPQNFTLDLELVDQATGEPLGGMPLNVRTDNRQSAFSTDDRGHALIDYPESAKYFGITVKSGGYVPTTLSWQSYQGKDPVPATFKLELERGTTIGGIVQDESGKPVKGVKVEIIARRKNEGNNARLRTSIDAPFTTDAQGRWRCDVVPKDLDDPWIRLSHPDYLSDEMYGMTPKPPLPQLRDQTGVMVIKKGIPVAGRVVDSGGKPIVGAQVAQGRDRFGSNFPTAKTSADGRFKFAQVRPGADMVLTVTAKGFSPDQKTLQLAGSRDDIEFKLEPGHVVKGRVVDPAGNPLAGVMIATDTWRGNRALMFRTNTKADGTFVWNEAPADEVLTDVLKQGFMDLRHFPLKATDQEITITVRRPVHVSGVVTDAETGKPVESFTFVQGIDWGNPGQQGIYWERYNRASGAKVYDGGKFEFDVTMPRAGHAVRVEADGYLPSESRLFKDDEGSVSLEFKLKKGADLAGVVRTPDGKPIAGAEVILALPPNGLYLRNGELQQRDSPIVQTDETGHYKLPPQLGKYAVVVLHDRGFAEATAEQLAKSADIVLQPWGRVTGVVRVGSKPAANEMISVSRQDAQVSTNDAPRVYHDIQASTDKDGRFTVERVPPGQVGVSRQVRINERMTTYANTELVDVRPGETAEVRIGGIGRPVVGKIDVPAEVAGKVDWTTLSANFSTKFDFHQPTLPDDWQDMDQPARQKWMEAWQKSPDAEAQRKASATMKHYAMKVKPDGTFRADDVPAGEYQMMISVMAPPTGGQSYSTEALAMVQHAFTVPPIPGGQSDDALDLGTIPMKAIKNLKPGEVVTEIAGADMDGKPTKLSDLRGKVVLVHFYAADHSPALVPEFASLKKVWDALGKDPRFTMLSCSLDAKPDAPKRFLAKHPATWPQVYVGDWQKTEVPREWNVNRFPSLYLVAPDGKLLARDLTFDGLEAKIRAALDGK